MADLITVLESGGIPYKEAPHQRVRRGWVGVDCPKCSPGHSKFRLGFELSTGRAHCWVCGAFYAPDILSKLLRISLQDAHEKLGISGQRRWRRPEADEKPEGVLRIPPGVGELLPAHQHYLISRNLDPSEIASTWGVQGIGMSGPLKWRLFIPICDRLGRVVSWTTRSISQTNPIRYWSAQESEEVIPHKSLLYGAHLARHTIVICEGPIDVWSIGPGAVATCGVGFNDAQKAVMASFPVRVVCFDAEDDAQKRARSLCNDLSMLPGLTENALLETGKDANECTPEEIRELRLRYFPELYT